MSHVRAGNATMSRPLYLAHMDQLATLEHLAAKDAAEALIVLGWPIQQHGPDMDHWRISSLILTDDELIGLAIRRGIQPAIKRVQ